MLVRGRLPLLNWSRPTLVVSSRMSGVALRASSLWASFKKNSAGHGVFRSNRRRIFKGHQRRKADTVERSHGASLPGTVLALKSGPRSQRRGCFTRSRRTAAPRDGFPLWHLPGALAFLAYCRLICSDPLRLPANDLYKEKPRTGCGPIRGFGESESRFESRYPTTKRITPYLLQGCNCSHG
jgi:hypothetical protein